MYEKGPRPWFTVCVEGNIGSGKTTLVQYFARSNLSQVEVFEEPVKKWRQFKGHNLLELLYKDPCRYSHLFQSYVQLTMMELHLRPSLACVKLMERSIYAARYCFVENLYSSGKMSAPEYHVYCGWFDMITKNMDVGVDLIVYLRTNPSVVSQRIKERCRSEEQQIPVEYLESLHTLHEDWLVHRKFPTPAPVLILDANDDLQTMQKKFKEHASYILCQRTPIEVTNDLPLSPIIAENAAAS